MTMADGQNVLKRIAFQIGNKLFRFAINPENMVYTRPHRTTAIKTKSRIILEDFGSDIPTVSIGGTTGFNPTGRAEDRGIAKIKELKEYIQAYADMGGNGNAPAEEFYFHDFTNDESYVVHLSPEGVTYTQDVNSPLLHRYQIKFIILRKSTEPADGDVVNPIIGNRYPVLGIPSGTPTIIGTPFNPNIPNNGIPMPSPNAPNTGIPMPSPGAVIDLNPPGAVIDLNPPADQGAIFDMSNGGMTRVIDLNPVNPQAPSYSAYQYGATGLGFNIGYYGRGYSV
jgi:hypothetical protein